MERYTKHKTYTNAGKFRFGAPGKNGIGTPGTDDGPAIKLL
jgi:hypothetical protein